MYYCNRNLTAVNRPATRGQELVAMNSSLDLVKGSCQCFLGFIYTVYKIFSAVLLLKWVCSVVKINAVVHRNKVVRKPVHADLQIEPRSNSAMKMRVVTDYLSNNF